MEPRITPATVSVNVANQVVLTLVDGENISDLHTSFSGTTLTITDTTDHSNTGISGGGVTVSNNSVSVNTTTFSSSFGPFAGLVVNAAGGSQPVTVVVNSSGIDLSAVPGNANQLVSIDLSLSQDPADAVTLNSAIKTKGTGTVELNATNITLAAAGDITNAGNVDITGPSKIETAGDITSSGNITFNNAVTLTGDITLTGNTPTFTGGVTGANHDLTLNFSGTTTIGATFTGIKNLTTNSGGTTSISSAITTTGNQTYNDAVTLSANTTLNSGGSNIIFNSSLNGAAFNLGLSAGAGTISATSVNISDLTITNGASAAFTGPVTVNDLITTATATTISLTGTGNTFAVPVDFLNTGLVTLGDGTDTFLFSTGLNFTGNAASNVGGLLPVLGMQSTLVRVGLLW